MDALLKERILDFHQTGIPAYIKRDAVVTHVKDMVTTIVGGSKAGKTYLTYQVIAGRRRECPAVWKQWCTGT